MANNLNLKDKSLVIVFAYAPAGLGHLRVTDALYDGLPTQTAPILLGAQDKSITWIHRIISIHPIMRSIFEWGQHGVQQYFVTAIYRFMLRRRSKLIYQQIATVLSQRMELPKTILIVATHFGLAHQIAALKDKIHKEIKVKVILAVQVTDDSPQYMWYVPGADLTFVPSEKTKLELEKYGKESRLEKINTIVTPYPVSPELTNQLSENKYREKLKQFNDAEKSKINVAIPISGAAVGMAFFVRLVDELYQKSPRFQFHIISKITLYTLPYLNEFMSRPYVRLHLAKYDKEVVRKYEEMYKKNVIGLEITKPSEQAFKALIRPEKVGGPILLFAKPVGRQEYDNVDFLMRHALIPTKAEHRFLYDHACRNISLKTSLEGKKLLEKSRLWRGILLPNHSNQCANLVFWALKEWLFLQMVKCRINAERKDSKIEELNPTGVEEFWLTVTNYLDSNL
jgi:hypothetical protein